MAQHAQVVIGTNFGDEGKGLITDFLAAPHGARVTVVRFNGGAQAGHTVVTPDGRRHVFSHFGCGTFAGAATFLSRWFVCNPLLFEREWAELRPKLDQAPVVAADGAAPVTTPYDMLVNQAVEDARGTGRHGSVGIGFGETIERNLHARYTLTVADLADPGGLRARLDVIRRHWVPARLQALGAGHMLAGLQGLLEADTLIEQFLAATGFFRERVRIEGAALLGRTAGPVIFEGAQGLLLDQDRGWFPHVTRSNTGLRNALAVAAEAGIDRLAVTYVTRAYLTRHGAGPLAHELADRPYPGVRDDTNLTGRYQGSLRFAWLDLDQLARAVAEDLSDVPAGFRVTVQAAVTCLDQLDATAFHVEGGVLRQGPAGALPERIRQAIGADTLLVSRGPTRATVTAEQVGEAGAWPQEHCHV